MKFQKILILLIISFSLNAYSSYSGVYFCSDTHKTGFEPKENFKVYPFKGNKFKAKIDFEKKEVISKEIFFIKDFQQACLVNELLPPSKQSVLCVSDLGTSFTFYPESGYYARSDLLGVKKPGDSILVAYGTCEKF